MKGSKVVKSSKVVKTSKSIKKNKNNISSLPIPATSARNIRQLATTIKKASDEMRKQTYTDMKFNALFHSPSIYSAIIDNYNLQPHKLFYCQINKKNMETNLGVSTEDIFNTTQDGRFIIRITSEKSMGHAICIYKEDNKYTVFDSNDYKKETFKWEGTKALIHKLKLNANNIIISGYKEHNISPMKENICTLFALYAWLINPVSQRPTLKMNTVSSNKYLKNIMTKLTDNLQNMSELHQTMLKLLQEPHKYI